MASSKKKSSPRKKAQKKAAHSPAHKTEHGGEHSDHSPSKTEHKSENHPSKTIHHHPHSPSGQKKESDRSTMVKILVVIAVLALVLFVHFRPMATESTPTTVANDTLTVQKGDTVKVHYVGKFENGTVFDTSRLDVAEENGIPRDGTPLEVEVGSGSVIEGFDKALLGMQVGEKKTVTIPPEKGYGFSDPSKVTRVPRVERLNRTIELERTATLSKERFAEVFGENATMGKTVSAEELPWKMKVTKIDGDEITLEVIAKVGDQFTIPGHEWPSDVSAITDDTVVLYQLPRKGQVIDVPPLGQATISTTDDQIIITSNLKKGDTVGPYPVTAVEGDELVIDGNHPLADKTLVFDLELLEIEK